MNTESTERPALATPYELASIAIALAALNGQTKPDLEEAVRLLRRAALRGKDEKRPTIQFPDLVLCDDEATAKQNQEAFARMGAHTIVSTFDSHPEAQRESMERAKDFEGAADIKPPSRYPASPKSCWRAVLKRSPSIRELEAKKAAVLKTFPGASDFVEPRISSEVLFWMWAKNLIPYLPRRGPAKVTARRSRKSGTEGQFTRPKKGPDGKFQKK